MLGKILKYDLKSMGKSLFPLYVGLIVMALVLRIVDFITDSFSALDFIYNIMFVFFIIFLIGGLFYTFFVAIMRYYKNLYSDEGYLTHTLPVKSGSLLFSKVLSSLIYIIISVAVSMLSLIIVFGFSIFDVLNDGLEFFSLYFDLSIGTILIIGIIFILFSYISYVLMVYAGISLGNMHSKNKITFSVIYTVAIYYVSQILGLLAIGIMFLINPDIMSQLDQTIPDKQYFIQIMFIGIGLNVLLFIIYYYVCYNRLKHLNLS